MSSFKSSVHLKDLFTNNMIDMLVLSYMAMTDTKAHEGFQSYPMCGDILLLLILILPCFYLSSFIKIFEPSSL